MSVMKHLQNMGELFGTKGVIECDSHKCKDFRTDSTLVSKNYRKCSLQRLREHSHDLVVPAVEGDGVLL